MAVPLRVSSFGSDRTKTYVLVSLRRAGSVVRIGAASGLSSCASSIVSFAGAMFYGAIITLMPITALEDRLVDCPLLKRSFEALYSNLLPKGGHPWLYISLEIDPDRVDVNVHPTKREVSVMTDSQPS